MKNLWRKFLDWLAPEGWQDEKGFHYGKESEKRN